MSNILHRKEKTRLMFSHPEGPVSQAMSGAFENSSVANLRVSDPSVGRGGASCALLSSEGTPLTFQLGSQESPLRSPFGANVYGAPEVQEKATRLNLEVDVSRRDAVIAKFSEIDAQIVAWLRANGDKFKIKNPAEAKRPIVIHDPEYGSTRVRFKMNTAGLNAARGWSMADQTRIPDLKSGVNLKETPFVLVFQVSKVWSMSRELGCTLEVKHAICTNAVDDVFPMQLG